MKTNLTVRAATRISALALLVIALTAIAPNRAEASPKSLAPQTIPAFPGTLVNATYVYVASYDGDQFNPNLWPQDREAISTVQEALQKWGKFIVVYEPRQADIILRVMSRPSEDVLAMYDAHGPQGQWLWRMMSRGGLQRSEAPLVTDLQTAFNKANAK